MIKIRASQWPRPIRRMWAKREKETERICMRYEIEVTIQIRDLFAAAISILLIYRPDVDGLSCIYKSDICF